MTPAPLQLGQAPSEWALNSAGLTRLAFANALRIGSSSPVYVAGLLRREPRIAPWSIDTTPAPAGIDPCTSELFPWPATPVTTTPVEGPAEAEGPPRRTGAGTEVDDMVGDGDRLRLVLHDQDGVALVPQPQQQVVHPLDVVGVHAGRGFVEDVGDVGERGAEVADHLDALCFAARQRARRSLEREIAQSNLRERVEGVLECREERRHGRLLDAADPLGQVADLHRARV